MKKLILNLNALVSVKIKDKECVTDLVYREAIPKKHFWQTDKPAGFYDKNWGSYYTTQNLQNGKWYKTKLMIIEKAAYFKPTVGLCFFDGNKYWTEFNTYQEALDWGNKQAHVGMDVKLELDF